MMDQPPGQPGRYDPPPTDPAQTDEPALVVCPECGLATEVMPGEHPFCRRCDYPLFWVITRETAVADHVQPDLRRPDPPPTAAGWSCRVCTSPNPAGRLLCIHCAEPANPVNPRRRRTWEQSQPQETPVRPARRFAIALGTGFGLLLLIGGVVAVLAFFLWPSDHWEVQVLDTGEATWDISATVLGGQPFIAYVDSLDGSLRTVSCGDPACDGDMAEKILSNIAAIGGGMQGQGTAIASDSNGYPMIAFRRGEEQALHVAHCADARCEDTGAITIHEVDADTGIADLSIDAGFNPSIAIDSDDLPIISYHDRERGALKIARCEDPDCEEVTIAILDRSGAEDEGNGVGLESVIRIGPDGLPLIAFRDDDEQAIKLARCSDERCTQAVIQVVAQEDEFVPGAGLAMELLPGGAPVIAFANQADFGIYLARCDSAECSTSTQYRVDTATDGWSAAPTMTLGRDGLPVVAYRQRESGDEHGIRILRVVRCRDVECSEQHSPETVDDGGRVGYSPTLVTLPDGRIAIAYGDATRGSLKFGIRTR